MDDKIVKLRFNGPAAEKAVKAFFAWFLDGGGEDELTETGNDRYVSIEVMEWVPGESIDFDAR